MEYETDYFEGLGYDFDDFYEETYYDYKGKNLLTSTFQNNILNYSHIYLCCYNINKNGKLPFLMFLLINSTIEKALKFQQIYPLENMNKNELINFSKTYIFELNIIDDYESLNNIFNGFYEYENKLYLFFDITECNIEIIDKNINKNLSFVLIDEMINQKKMINTNIDETITDLFTLNEDLCFLCDENENNYEIPIVGYVIKPENKLNFTYIFGESKCDKNRILGPYYYFTDLNEIIKKSNNTKLHFVRFALFLGLTKYIENNEKDPIDESEIKKERLNDKNLNQNIRNFENLTLRISDHDGKWSENYDSVYLKNIKLDDNNILNKTYIVVKGYKQQIPLSYHNLN
jgi:hypothetical protein